MNLRKKMTASIALLVILVTVTAMAQVNSPMQRRHKLPPESPGHRPVPGGGPQFGDALWGLDPVNLEAFTTGRGEFEAVETPEGGLGPIFNGKSCVQCHSAAATGGASRTTVTRFGRISNGKFDPLDNLGGSLLQQFAIDPHAQEMIPPEANVVAHRLTTPLFGAGLIEAITDDDILRNAQRHQPDGIQGRAALVTDVASGQQRVGRFGWKAHRATLLTFAGDAYLNEMGVTNRFFPKENAPNGNQALLAQYDLVPDIEDTMDPVTGKSDIDHLANFMRFLAPPPQSRMNAMALAGGKIFEQLKCVACHTPVMVTGPNPIAALSYQPVNLFSDLLLHDMGKLGDGIELGAANGREMRTAPLWGLRARTSFLHDGRALSVADAIRAHDGKGKAARDRFHRLNPAEVRQLLEYLNTL
jgi:CxxC motif-containing protein (DUF1111 family)